MTDIHVQPSAVQSRAVRRRQVLAASIGNVIEWFDWFVYSLIATYFAAQFFPADSENSLVPLLSAFAVFAVGFIMRPIGGLIFGSIADRIGRRHSLTLTIVGMGIGSLLIAVSPTHAQIGILAPIILVVARVIQGLSAGGEYAAAATYLIESAPEGRRGFFSSLFFVTTIGGNLVAIFVVIGLQTIFTDQQITDGAWRIPFVLGTLAAAAGLWLRRQAEETHANAAEFAADPSKRPNPFEFLRKHPVAALKVVGITAAGTLTYYVFTVYMPTYASITKGFDLNLALNASIIALLWFIILQPVVGWISDKVGRKPVLLTFGIGFVVGAVPLMNLLTDSFWSLVLVQCLGLTLVAGWSATVNTVFAELYPSRVRSAGLGFPYAVAVALFGGTAPYLGTWMQENGIIEFFPWYISILAAVSTITYLTLKETAHKPLPQ